MNDRDPAALLGVAHALLDETDAVLERHFAAEVEVAEKADATLVTIADTEVETHLRSRLELAFPGHGLVGEEHGVEPGRGEARWIIDPLDGTHNFVRGIPVFATLLAFERAGELVLGVVSAPLMRQRWWAAAGQGARMRVGGRVRQIHVSEIDRLAEAQLCCSSVSGLANAGALEAWRRLVGEAWRDRGFGDFWGHMLVAQGSAEAMLEFGLNLWDVAAPAAIVTEAGGRVTDLAGRATWSGPDVLTTNARLHDRLLAALAEP